MTKFIVSTVAWGADYLDLLLSLSLPSLAAIGNLPALAESHSVRYVVTTTPEGEARLRDSAILSRIGRIVETEIQGTLAIDDKPAGNGSVNKYSHWSLALNDQIQRAHDERAWLVVWQPDSLFADGTLAAVSQIARENVRVINHCGSLIVDRDAFVPAVRQAHPAAEGEPLSLAPRELAKLAFDYFNPGMRPHIFNARPFANWPSVIYFPVPEEGVLVRVFHTSPLAFLLDKRVELASDDTVDLFFMEQVVDGPEQVYYANDTDLICGVNIAAPLESDNLSADGPNPVMMAQFVNNYATSIHRSHVMKPAYWHFSNMTSPVWQEMADRSDAFLQWIFDVSREPRADLKMSWQTRNIRHASFSVEVPENWTTEEIGSSFLTARSKAREDGEAALLLVMSHEQNGRADIDLSRMLALLREKMVTDPTRRVTAETDIHMTHGVGKALDVTAGQKEKQRMRIIATRHKHTHYGIVISSPVALWDVNPAFADRILASFTPREG